jgi:hypothetical protein
MSPTSCLFDKRCRLPLASGKDEEEDRKGNGGGQPDLLIINPEVKPLKLTK